MNMRDIFIAILGSDGGPGKQAGENADKCNAYLYGRQKTVGLALEFQRIGCVSVAIFGISGEF